MHVELVDLFRCLASHDDSWLVAAAHDTKDRVIIDGVLGCPICGAEYPIVEGVAMFAPAAPDRSGVNAARSNDRPEDADTFRLAAQLDLGAPGKTIALIGYGAHDALALQQLIPTRVVLVNAPVEPLDTSGEPVASIRSANKLPIAIASLHGVASRTRQLPVNVVDVLRTGGRIVAPHDAAIPPGTNEIARDNREWVVARDAVSSRPVQLSRRQVSE